MADLSEDMAAYESMRSELELDHTGKWVVIYDETLQGIYDDFQDAADFAVQRFGRGPYHIRRIGECPFTLPTSVFLRPMLAPSEREKVKAAVLSYLKRLVEKNQAN